MSPPLQDAVHSWQNFYSLLGGASATLIGLLFVAVTLGVRMITPDTIDRVHIFMTPAVLHFAAVLTVSAVMTMPAPSGTCLSVELTAISVGGLVYMAPVILGMKRIRREQNIPHSNVLWSTYLPAASYAATGAAAAMIVPDRSDALRVVSAAALLLLLANIRNAWLMTVFLASKLTE